MINKNKIALLKKQLARLLKYYGDPETRRHDPAGRIDILRVREAIAEGACQ